MVDFSFGATAGVKTRSASTISIHGPDLVLEFEDIFRTILSGRSADSPGSTKSEDTKSLLLPSSDIPSIIQEWASRTGLMADSEQRKLDKLIHPFQKLNIYVKPEMIAEFILSEPFQSAAQYQVHFWNSSSLTQ